MSRIPEQVAAEIAAAVSAERDARAAARAAVRRQVDLLGRLRDEGVPFTTAAIHVARALGEEATTAVRRRLAARFRQRTLRDKHHADRQAGSAQAAEPVNVNETARC